MRVRLRFQPSDLWVGVYWKWYRSNPKTLLTGTAWALDIYVCIVPMFPLHFFFYRTRTSKDGVCERMRSRPFPVSHRVQRNEGHQTCVACRGAL